MRQVADLELLTAAVTVTTAPTTPVRAFCGAFRAFCGPYWQRDTHPGATRSRRARSILATKGFSSAGRLSKLLRDVVEKTLAGETDQLKSTRSASRSSSATEFDPRLDSIVRVEAGRLRSRLDQYYSGEGAGSPIRINLPRGGYSAQFEQAPRHLRHPMHQAPQTRHPSPTMSARPTRDRLALRGRGHGDVAREPRSTSAADLRPTAAVLPFQANMIGETTTTTPPDNRSGDQ